MTGHSLRLATLLACCGIGAGGCGHEGKNSRLEVFPTSGQVTQAGQPASGVLVVLHPAPGSPPALAGLNPCATTDDKGEFQISTYEQNDGAPAGDYAITLRCHQAGPQAVQGPIPGLALPGDRFRSKYADSEKSPWATKIIESEDNVIPAINLE